MARARAPKPAGPRGVGGAGQAAWTALILPVLLAIPGSTVAGEVLRGPVPASLVRVIDGDTLVVEAQVWLGQRLDTHVRLAGIDAPELHGKCAEEETLARAATDRLERLAAEGPLVLRDIRLGTYAGRVVARVENAAGLDLSSELLSAGLAALYSGRGERPGWCG